MRTEAGISGSRRKQRKQVSRRERTPLPILPQLSSTPFPPTLSQSLKLVPEGKEQCQITEELQPSRTGQTSGKSGLQLCPRKKVGMTMTLFGWPGRQRQLLPSPTFSRWLLAGQLELLRYFQVSGAGDKGQLGCQKLRNFTPSTPLPKEERGALDPRGCVQGRSPPPSGWLWCSQQFCAGESRNCTDFVKTTNHTPQPHPSRTALPGSLWAPGGQLCLHKTQRRFSTKDNLGIAWWTQATAGVHFLIYYYYHFVIYIYFFLSFIFLFFLPFLSFFFSFFFSLLYFSSLPFFYIDFFFFFLVLLFSFFCFFCFFLHFRYFCLCWVLVVSCFYM